MDARNYRVIPIAAPTQEERARPYMWRFWNQLPRAGSSSIFDRSWYGRVLVEPAEGLCSQEEWDRYDALVHLMVERTSNTVARWTLVEGNDKLHARLKVIRVLCEGLEDTV